MTLTKVDHFDDARTPKRVLALDGGGIRGVLTLEYLAAIEELLRRRFGRNDLVLSDYFDLIGGTSTGAILAALLACGNAVADIKQLYRNLGTTVFKQALHVPLLSPKFPAEPLRQLLSDKFGKDTTLGSDTVRTGLMVMTKRLDTGSPWPLHNHPRAPYAEQDGKLLLADIVRASTAAPTYFTPEAIDISSRTAVVTRGAFVDGGVSPFNDPALQLLMLVALEGHGFRWTTGEDKLLIISAGTGTFREPLSTGRIMNMTAAEQGLRALQSLMDDCARANHTMLQWLTNCLTPWTIDRAVQDMRNDSAKGPRLATYARYNVRLDSKWISDNLHETYAPEQLVKIAAMDDPGNMNDLSKLGALAAKDQIREEHFPRAFDVL
jgi:hypothetical protein